MGKRIEEEKSESSGGLMMPIASVTAVFVFIILCFYAYNNITKNKSDSEVVVLNGDNSSFKVAPQNPGGMKVEHTDKEVFNTVNGKVENIEQNNVNLEQAETPISKDALAANVANENNKPAEKEETSSTIVINASETDGTISTNVEKTGEPIAEDASPEAIALKEDIKTNAETAENLKNLNEQKNSLTDLNDANKKSENIISENNPNTKTENAEKSLAKTTEDKKLAELKTEAKQSEPANNLVNPVKLKESSETLDYNKKTIKADVKKEINKSTGENKTIIQFKELPKSMRKEGSGTSTPQALAEKGAYYIQVSSHASKAEADSVWRKFSEKYKSEVSGKSKNIVEAQVKGKNFYRLSFGPFKDRADASTKCGILKAKGQDCIIQKN